MVKYEIKANGTVTIDKGEMDTFENASAHCDKVAEEYNTATALRFNDYRFLRHVVVVINDGQYNWVKAW